MATIRALRALRYSEAAGALENLVAPPYDVLNQNQRDELASRSPFNVVHMTLPPSDADDRSKFVKYARSAAALMGFRREGVLVLEDQPTIYRYVQTFTIPGAENVPLTRTTFIALLKVEPYENGVVLPHEQTFPKHKEDRLRILEATRSHLECIFGLVEDDDRALFNSLTAAPASNSFSVKTDDEVHHQIDLIQDETSIAILEKLMRPRKVWIADGHHRYETALNFRNSIPAADHPVAEDFMLMAFGSMADPGLALLPTHRVIKGRGLTLNAVAERTQTFFEARSVSPEAAWSEVEAAGLHAFGVVAPNADSSLGALVLTPKPDVNLIQAISSDQSEGLKSLDVSILHSVVLEQCLEIKGFDSIAYTRDPQEALAWAAEGNCAFLMNPPSVEDMRRIAIGGEKMPQKSTFYYPKILSGLILWSLNDF